MNAALLALAFFGLFALLFNGVFALGLFVASISAILISIFNLKKANHPQQVKWLVLILALTIIISCIYDAYSYFSVLHMPGNSYGVWPWSVALIICTLITTKSILLSSRNNKRP